MQSTIVYTTHISGGVRFRGSAEFCVRVSSTMFLSHAACNNVCVRENVNVNAPPAASPNTAEASACSCAGSGTPPVAAAPTRRGHEPKSQPRCSAVSQLCTSEKYRPSLWAPYTCPPLFS